MEAAAIERDIDLGGLRRMLTKLFTLEELHTLCADLGTDFEEFAGDTKSAKAREIVKGFYRNGKLALLFSAARELFPNAAWSDITGHEVADTLPDEWAEPLQRLYALVRQFNRNRHLPFTDQRTFQGDDIAFRMRELAPYVFDQFDLASWLDSSSPGKRLAAIKYLDWLQDVEYLTELLTMLATESPFMQLHLLITIYHMVDQVERQRIGLVQAAMTTYKLRGPDGAREHWRTRIVAAL